MGLQPGLCQTWSESPKTGFFTTRPIFTHCLHPFQKFDKESLLPILATLQVNIVYTPNKACDKRTYGCYIRERFESILNWLRYVFILTVLTVVDV